ncbi:hypothetical protein CK203_027477 [Vitis vinifera]|nr:hypothetical protein CK203_086930 [Vitis vinifera]RVX06286.1 hypothetical protein CK203_027477 [Vitis vinifera]
MTKYGMATKDSSTSKVTSTQEAPILSNNGGLDGAALLITRHKLNGASTYERRPKIQRMEVTTNQEKGDLGVITVENQVTPRTPSGKSMRNQQIRSHHVLKLIEKVEDTISPLKTTQHYLIPIHSAKSKWN